MIAHQKIKGKFLDYKKIKTCDEIQNFTGFKYRKVTRSGTIVFYPKTSALYFISVKDRDELFKECFKLFKQPFTAHVTSCRVKEKISRLIFSELLFNRKCGTLTKGSNIFGSFKKQNFYIETNYRGYSDFSIDTRGVISCEKVKEKTENIMVSVYPRGRVIVNCDFLPEDLSFVNAICNFLRNI